MMCVSLFQMLTFDQWYKIYQELKVSAPEGLVTIFSVSWVWIGGFVFRNIFVGVMVRGFDQATQEKSSGSEDLTELESKPMEFDAIRSDMKILHDNAIENIIPDLGCPIDEDKIIASQPTWWRIEKTLYKVSILIWSVGDRRSL